MGDDSRVVGCVVSLLVIIFVVCSGGFSCWNKYVHGNKQFIDMKQKFNTAYIKLGDKTEKMSISKWNDYENSDTIQVVTKDGKAYYTHSVNVVLTNE